MGSTMSFVRFGVVACNVSHPSPAFMKLQETVQEFLGRTALCKEFFGAHHAHHSSTFYLRPRNSHQGPQSKIISRKLKQCVVRTLTSERWGDDACTLVGAVLCTDPLAFRKLGQQEGRRHAEASEFASLHG